MNDNIIIDKMNIIFIDWDDTLFPTHFLLTNKFKINEENDYIKYKLHFIELDKKITNLINTLVNECLIFIVTNANLVWIAQCLNILPLTKQIIKLHNIAIISSREQFYKTQTADEWKILTFRNIINNNMYKSKQNQIINIISLGDSKYEYNGLIHLDEYINLKFVDKCFLLKSINFIIKPSFNEILEQLHIVNNNIIHIINVMEYVDLNCLSNN